MYAWQVEFSLRVTELESGVVIDLWLGDELQSIHWGIDETAAATVASVAVAGYLKAGLEHTG